jgi:ornithine decarboxylase
MPNNNAQTKSPRSHLAAGLSAKEAVRRDRAAAALSSPAHQVIDAGAIFEARLETHLDTHPEVALDLDVVKRLLAERGYERPVLVLDSALVRAKVQRFCRALPRVRPHYAVKANPDPRVLKTLIEEGAGFEIASPSELDALLALGVPGREVFYSNPIKSRAQIAYAAANGVEWFVFDCVEELAKFAEVKPDAKLYLRIDAPNIGSDWPLAGKFGVSLSEVDPIIDEARRLKLDVAGVTFHVGSQCRNPENWRVGLQRARSVFDKLIAAGFEPRLLNLGGGYPVRLTKPIPSIEAIAAVVNEELAHFPQHVRVIAEPGRYLVSDSGWYVVRVIGTATRLGKRWMYWDAGVFGGVFETTDGLRYDLHTDRTGKAVEWNVAGPTCDSVDVCLRDEALPADLAEGDFVYIKNAGVYTTAYATNFNGFPLPDVVVL